MILQLGGILTGVFESLKAPLLSFGAEVGRRALDVGTQFAAGAVNRELNRAERRALEDNTKAQLRAAANAIAPVAAPGQTAQFSSGPATGTAYIPPTLFPPSPSPINQQFGVNPGLLTDQVFTRRELMGAPGVQPSLVLPTPPLQAQPAFFGALARPLLQGGLALARRLAPQFSLRTPTGRRMLGLGAAAVAAETAATAAISGIVSPGVATAPGRRTFRDPIIQETGSPLRLGGVMPEQMLAPTPTGLPSMGRYQREPNGCMVQWYFFDGQQQIPIDRDTAKEKIKRDAIYRLDVFKGKFIKLKSRRMNPMNVRAFFRAGRRVDAGERICRKMFSEKRRQKTGTIRRKTRKRKK